MSVWGEGGKKRTIQRELRTTCIWPDLLVKRLSDYKYVKIYKHMKIQIYNYANDPLKPYIITNIYKQIF